MKSSALNIAILVATMTSGCVFGPAAECEVSSELTSADCTRAVQAALPKLPNDMAATKLVVRAGCSRDQRCLPMTNELVITVEVTFKAGDRLGVIGVVRTTWEATELRYLPAPTMP